jgi:zinc transporter, ZIP family
VNDTIRTALIYSLLPIAALVFTGMLAAVNPVGKVWVSRFQHFASGVIISSVALELLPVSLESGSLIGMVLGYVVGVAAMLMIDHYADKAATNIPIAIDLFIDGLLLMIGFAAGRKGGMLLLLGLTLETTALGMVIGPTLAAEGPTKMRAIFPLTGLALSILVGAACGLFLPQKTGFWFAAIIGFGIAALLFLVVEELIAEAHEIPDTPFTTTLFFIGFLIPLVLWQVHS